MNEGTSVDFQVAGDVPSFLAAGRIRGTILMQPLTIAFWIADEPFSERCRILLNLDARWEGSRSIRIEMLAEVEPYARIVVCLGTYAICGFQNAWQQGLGNDAGERSLDRCFLNAMKRAGLSPDMLKTSPVMKGRPNSPEQEEGTVEVNSRPVPSSPQEQDRDNTAQCVADRNLFAAAPQCSLVINSPTSSVHDKALAHAYRAISELAKDNGDHDGRAMADANAAIELDSSVGEGYLAKGVTYINKGKSPSAIEFLDQAIALDLPTSLRGPAYNARFLVHDEWASSDLVRAALDSNERDKKWYKQHADMEHKLALMDIEEAINLWPTDGEYYRNKAIVESQMGQSAAALADTQTADRLDRKN